jgi:4-hydroxybenzoate polyprenyltransferase
MAAPQRAEIVEFRAPRSPVRAAVVALRPRQWSKNLLVFAGLVFAAKLGDAGRWLEALTVFAAYCAISSAAYLVNDVRDREDDRRHPVKRARPIARGELSPRAALVLAAGLAALALGLSIVLGPASVALLLAFAALQAGYTLALKHVVLLDVLAIGALFVVRAAAGAEAVDVRISPCCSRSSSRWQSGAASSSSSARSARRAGRFWRGIRSSSSTSSSRSSPRRR